MTWKRFSPIFQVSFFLNHDETCDSECERMEFFIVIMRLCAVILLRGVLWKKYRIKNIN